VAVDALSGLWGPILFGLGGLMALVVSWVGFGVILSLALSGLCRSSSSGRAFLTRHFGSLGIFGPSPLPPRIGPIFSPRVGAVKFSRYVLVLESAVWGSGLFGFSAMGIGG
jgi:hypothetical protein